MPVLTFSSPASSPADSPTGSLPKILPGFSSQMDRKQNLDSSSSPLRIFHLVLLSAGFFSCILVYTFLSSVLRFDYSASSSLSNLDGQDGNLECCRGVENLELWGAAVKWGSQFKFNSSEECCKACKGVCSGNDGPCLCDSWVFCGDKEACGPKFGECWLKKQKDTLAPEKQDAGKNVIWTSGLIFGKGEGIIGLETEHGTLHIKLFPDCAPHSVAYILELLGLHHCAGCQFYRAEGRGESWDSEGNHIPQASFGPPFALIQGTLESQGTEFHTIATEACPTIQRGSVAWVGGGPEFFISLAEHQEWKNTYTVFGSVLPKDMHIAEKIAQLPTQPDNWNNIKVSVLEKPVSISVRRLKLKGELK